MKNTVLNSVLIIAIILFPVFAFSQNVGIGLLSPDSKLHIKGSADATQLIIDANTPQTNTNPLIKLRSSSGEELMWIHSDHPSNTFLGLDAGRLNNAGSGSLNNTFIGAAAGTSNTGAYNTATGLGSMTSNTTGASNTSSGMYSLTSNTTGSQNTAIGTSALFSQSYSPGYQWFPNNVAVGYDALHENQPISVLTGINNTAIGTSSLRSNTTGSSNTGVGYRALFSNTKGYSNTAVGLNALTFNSTGSRSTAIGDSALFSQLYFNGGNAWISNNVAVGFEAMYTNSPTSTSNGINNTAVGTASLRSNTIGYNNAATGYRALFTNTTGFNNTANGVSALFSNTMGTYNTANGYVALYSNTVGTHNTANGHAALYFNTSASRNTAIGDSALYAQSFSNGGSVWLSNNVAIGVAALYANQPTSILNGSNNTAVGNNALRSNNIGHNNTANGSRSLFSNTAGIENTASGMWSLFSNTIGNNNTAGGNYALYYNVAGNNGVAFGYQSQINANNINTSWDNTNTSLGYLSLRGSGIPANNTGIDNTAIGREALLSNSSGQKNTAIGYRAGYPTPVNANSTGSKNTFLGYNTGFDSGTQRSNTTTIGYNAKVDMDNALILGGTGVDAVSVGIGTSTPVTQLHLFNSSNIGPQITLSAPGGGIPGIAFRPYQNIGDWVTAPQALITVTDNNYSANINFSTKNQGAIGNAIVQRMVIQNDGNVGIGITNPGDKLVVFNNTSTGTYTSTGWMHSSDSRLKTNIRPLESCLAKIMKLQGLSYNWKSIPNDNNQIGFIAQDVEKVFPEVISKDLDGNYSMAPQNLTAPIIEAIKEQQQQMNSMEITIKKLELMIENMQLTIVSLQKEKTEMIREP